MHTQQSAPLQPGLEDALFAELHQNRRVESKLDFAPFTTYLPGHRLPSSQSTYVLQHMLKEQAEPGGCQRVMKALIPPSVGHVLPCLGPWPQRCTSTLGGKHEWRRQRWESRFAVGTFGFNLHSQQNSCVQSFHVPLCTGLVQDTAIRQGPPGEEGRLDAAWWLAQAPSSQGLTDGKVSPLLLDGCRVHSACLPPSAAVELQQRGRENCLGSSGWSPSITGGAVPAPEPHGRLLSSSVLALS